MMNQSVNEATIVEEIDWHNISEKLTERQGNLTRLMAAFNDGERLILISGPSGVGKTTLALGLKDQVANMDCGHFISGKFDQLEAGCQTTATLFGPFVQAFTQYIEKVVAEGAEAVTCLKTTLIAALDGNERQVLRDTIPALAKILGSYQMVATERTSVIKGPDAESRFFQIVETFVRALCSRRQPLVVFLDDIQWANQSALQLLTNLALLAKECPELHLTLLCTCRTDDMSAEHPFIVVFRNMCDQKEITFADIHVANLTEVEVCEVMLDTLHVSSGDAAPLSKAAYQQTGGNLLFLIMMVEAIHEDGILWETGKPQADGLPSKLPYHSVTQLIVRKVQKLPDDTKRLLKVASFLGSTFPIALLPSLGFETSDITVKQLKGLLTFDMQMGTARFAHDRIQKVVCTLVPESERAATHLRLGRQLWGFLPKDLRDEHLLLIAHLISRGVELVGDPHDQNEIAEIFYWAGQKAAISSAFVTSAAYLNLGINLFHPGHWIHSYEFSLRLYNLTSEIEYYNGNLKRVDDLVAVILKRARTLDDTLQAHFTRIYSLGSRNEFRLALEESLDLLKRLGEHFPRKPSIVQLMFGLLQSKRVLHGVTDEIILNLPVLRDKRKLAVIRLLIMTIFFAFHLREKLFPLLVFRLVQTILQDGTSDMACCGFALLSVVLAFRGQVDEAYRYGKLSLRLLNTNADSEWQARVVGAVHGILMPLKQPFRDSLQALKDAHQSGLVVGDIYFSMICANTYCRMSLAAGRPLSLIVTGARKYIALSKQYGQHYVLFGLQRQIQFCLTLMGQSDDSLFLTGDAMDGFENLERPNQNDLVKFVKLHIFKLMLAVYTNNLEVAQGICFRLRKFRKIKLDVLHKVDYLFFEGMATAMANNRKRTKEIVLELKKYARHAPSNFSHKVVLLEAELASNSSNRDLAMTSFKRAIDLAGSEGLIHEQALARERAAYALRRCHRHQEAINYLVDAQSLYQEWGAMAKVDQLSALISCNVKAEADL